MTSREYNKLQKFGVVNAGCSNIIFTRLEINVGYLVD